MIVSLKISGSFCLKMRSRKSRRGRRWRKIIFSRYRFSQILNEDLKGHL